jgi:hypothetical protein
MQRHTRAAHILFWLVDCILMLVDYTKTSRVGRWPRDMWCARTRALSAPLTSPKRRDSWAMNVSTGLLGADQRQFARTCGPFLGQIG